MRLAIALLLILATPAAAQMTCTQVGTVTMCTYPDGRIVTCTTVGTVTTCS